jgi:hypothetical protein
MKRSAEFLVSHVCSSHDIALPAITMPTLLLPSAHPSYSMGRIFPPRQLCQEIRDLQMELKAALVDLGHKSTFDLSLKEAWNPEIEAMGNS